MASRPLIAHIIFSLSTGGLENGLVNIINRFPVDRYRHVIICLTTADDFATRITAEGVQVIQLHKREGHDWGCYLKLRKLLKDLRPDIIHSRNLAALEAQWCSLGLGAVRVHGEHGREINDLDGTNWKYLNFRRVMRLLIHQYIAVSRDLENWLKASVGVAPARVSHIYNGVDFRRFQPGTVKPLALLPAHWQGQNDIVIVGTVGRLTPVKDQQLLLLAAAWVRENQPELFDQLRVIIVGDGPLAVQLEELASTLSLTEVVWFAGDRDDVPDLLATLDVFVLPSLAEGISNTILEAMASGLPVLATASGGNLELVEQGFNGALFPVSDHCALGEALVEQLSDPQKRKELGDNAHQAVVKNFNWDRTVAAYLDVYDQVLARKIG
ncbi:MAG: TIGR03088 family PEP-CTERM/XrtA system glycosyltransferase [Halioglobus sp.]